MSRVLSVPQQCPRRDAVPTGSRAVGAGALGKYHLLGTHLEVAGGIGIFAVNAELTEAFGVPPIFWTVN